MFLTIVSTLVLRLSRLSLARIQSAIIPANSMIWSSLIPLEVIQAVPSRSPEGRHIVLVSKGTALRLQTIPIESRFFWTLRLSLSWGNLIRHKYTHTGEKPYACDQCDFKCNERRNLIRHKQTHSGEKPYACDQCEYRCNGKRNLIRHKQTHTGEKPHACDRCEYRCLEKHSLIRHKRTHTGANTLI